MLDSSSHLETIKSSKYRIIEGFITHKIQQSHEILRPSDFKRNSIHSNPFSTESTMIFKPLKYFLLSGIDLQPGVFYFYVLLEFMMVLQSTETHNITQET